MTKPRGRIKSKPEDFVVDEIPAYLPSGTGDHLYVHFRKRNRTTDDVVKELARAANVDRRDIGVAGLKDKVGVTTQWISLPVPPKDPGFDERVRALAIEGVELLEATRHGNKLKTGHLNGNRFTIVVRDVAAEDSGRVHDAFDRILREGVPNRFGAQRFGRFGDTADKARAWLTGKARAPGDPRQRRFEFSALQSAIFNAVLDARVADGTWNVPQLGDVLEKEESGGKFVCTDVQADRERAARGEVCPTGPIVGDRMRQPEGAVLELEQRIAAPFLDGIDLVRARSLGEGTRRALVLRIAKDDASSIVQVMDSKDEGSPEQRPVLAVCFVLPKGAYATTVLGEVFAIEEEE